MPIKFLNYWKNYLKTATFVNLFGPTETTDICCYYIVDTEFHDLESLPIGYACEGLTLYIIDEEGNIIKDKHKIGQLYVEGPFVAQGYYHNPEKTKEVFIENAITKQINYKTGDLVAYNDKFQLVYYGRQDYQIKHLGYRIELGEIETIMNTITGIQSCVCLFDEQTDELILFYEGNEKAKHDIMMLAKQRLTEYMVPSKIIHIKTFPMNANGKIDKLILKEKYREELRNGTTI